MVRNPQLQLQLNSCLVIKRADNAESTAVVKRKGAEKPSVLACTLLPYSEEFELGTTLEAAERSVQLNHPHCARFCVLGGASCSG